MGILRFILLLCQVLRRPRGKFDSASIRLSTKNRFFSSVTQKVPISIQYQFQVKNTFSAIVLFSKKLSHFIGKFGSYEKMRSMRTT